MTKRTGILDELGLKPKSAPINRAIKITIITWTETIKLLSSAYPNCLKLKTLYKWFFGSFIILKLSRRFPFARTSLLYKFLLIIINFVSNILKTYSSIKNTKTKNIHRSGYWRFIIENVSEDETRAIPVKLLWTLVYKLLSTDLESPLSLLNYSDVSF